MKQQRNKWIIRIWPLYRERGLQLMVNSMSGKKMLISREIKLHTHTNFIFFSLHKQIPPSLTPSSHPSDLFDPQSSHEKWCIQANSPLGMVSITGTNWCRKTMALLTLTQTRIQYFLPQTMIRPHFIYLSFAHTHILTGRHTYLQTHTHTHTKYPLV